MRISVIPGARKNEIVGRHGDSIKIKIHAPPEGGRANTELCAFVASLLRVAKSRVSVVRGMTSRQKVLRVDGMSDEEAEIRLLNA